MTTTIRITGLNEVVRDLERLPHRLQAALQRYAASKKSGWVDFLKANIQAIVYDVYAPTTYRRRGDQPLKEAVAARTSAYLSYGVRGVLVRIEDDETRIAPTQPKGGSSVQDVPWEIETGTFPEPWYGYSLPRPAYNVTADFLQPRVESEVAEIVGGVIRE